MIGMTDSLPWTQLEIGKRACGYPDRVAPDPVLGTAAACLGGPFIRMRMQKKKRIEAAVTLFIGGIPAGLCAHESVENKPEETPLFEEIRTMVKGAESEVTKIGSLWVRSNTLTMACLAQAASLRLEHRVQRDIPTAYMTTVYKNAPIEEITLAYDHIRSVLRPY